MSLLSFLLTPPKSRYTNVYELAKYEVTWKMFLFLSIALIPTTIIYLFFDYNAFSPSIYALITCSVQLWWLYKIRNYKLCGFVYVVHGILFLGAELVFMKDTLHLIEFPWFFVFSIYGLLVIGKRTGFLLMFISLSFIIFYLFFSFADNIASVMPHINDIQLVAVVLNLLMAMILMIYIVVEFKRTHAYAEKKIRIANDDLLKKSKLIEAQNEEKTIMLKEIHHRVKNNLQVVCSLIRLQSFETEDIEAKKMFDATVGRVVAMALIHEKMYQKDNLSKINLADYFKSLAQDLLSSYATNKQIIFTINSELEIIGNRTIVPLALIFNELISNSLKHAFEEVDKGEINVSINVFNQDNFTIRYHDNGKWVKRNKESSFGLELINTFTEQLDGKIERYSNENGTTYIFKLKNIE